MFCMSRTVCSSYEKINANTLQNHMTKSILKLKRHGFRENASLRRTDIDDRAFHPEQLCEDQAILVDIVVLLPLSFWEVRCGAQLAARFRKCTTEIDPFFHIASQFLA